MFARASSRVGLDCRTAGLVGAFACGFASAPIFAQAVPAANSPTVLPPSKRAFAEPLVAQDGRFVIRVLAEKVDVHAEPDIQSPVIAQMEQGIRHVALQRRGTWYQLKLADGRMGWAAYVSGGVNPNFSVTADDESRRERPLSESLPAAPASAAPNAAMPAASNPSDDEVVLRRPMGRPIEPTIPEIDPSRVASPSPWLPRSSLPVPDRWRLADQLGLIDPRWYDPYNPNPLKGDRPIYGDDWFFNLGVISDTTFEARRIPTPIGAQSTLNAGADDMFGRGAQSLFNQNLIISLSLIKGDTTFRPPDVELRFVPVLNFNRTVVDEVRTVNIDPRRGTTRNDGIVAIQELFADVHLRNVSESFDFDSLRVGIQPFTADFRGLLYIDQPVGIRLFGTRDNNQYQYNIAWFRRLEKDTNSGLNDVGKPLRNEDIVVANVYRQDTFVPGFTLQGTLIYDKNRDNGKNYYDQNGFLARPAAIGDERPHKYQVTYLGLNGDGHFDRWNLTSSLYYAVGSVDHDPVAQQRVNVNALYAVGEISRDFDWVRVRGTGLFQSGDKNPFDGKATGFDAILEDPQIAGAATSYWIRQAVPLIGGGGVALSGRNGVLAALRSSKDEGQANFVNPGLALVGIGADADVTPRLRIFGNLNQLWFANTSSLSVLRNQGAISTSLGTDVSVALQYRPLFSQNIVVAASGAALFAGQGLKQLYSLDGDKTQYSILFNMVLAF